MIQLHDSLEFAFFMWCCGIPIGMLVRRGLNDLLRRKEFMKGKAEGWYEAAILGAAEQPIPLAVSKGPLMRRVK